MRVLYVYQMITFEALTNDLECLIKLIKELEGIETDCLKLGKSGNLTEYGEGQMDIIRMIRGAFAFQSLNSLDKAKGR